MNQVTEQQRNILMDVVQRFINLGEPTSRRQLIRKFKDSKSLDELLKRPFFYPVKDGEYQPMPLAFHHCGNSDILAKARIATEKTLWTLQNLDEAHPEKPDQRFTVEEYVEHATRIYTQPPDKAELLLGLYLTRASFGIFASSSGLADSLHTPVWFCLNESIVTIDPGKAWDELIAAQEKPATTPTFQFDGTAYEPVFSTRPGAIRPSGEYHYHPEIERVSGSQYAEGNFRGAVLDAFIHVIAMVRDRAAIKNRQGGLLDGDDLMNRAFKPDDNQIPPFRFNPLQSDADKDEQRGIWYLFRGIVGLRNFKAHRVINFDDPERAHEYLALASLLMRLLDKASNKGETWQPEPPESA